MTTYNEALAFYRTHGYAPEGIDEREFKDALAAEPLAARPLASQKMNEGMRLLSRMWPVDREYACKTCGSPAHKAPNTQWGCPRCGFLTFSPDLHFTKRGGTRAA